MPNSPGTEPSRSHETLTSLWADSVNGRNYQALREIIELLHHKRVQWNPKVSNFKAVWRPPTRIPVNSWTSMPVKRYMDLLLTYGYNYWSEAVVCVLGDPLGQHFDDSLTVWFWTQWVSGLGRKWKVDRLTLCDKSKLYVHTSHLSSVLDCVRHC